MSPEERKKRSDNAKAAAAEKLARKRWYIQLNVKPAIRYVNSWGGRAYKKHVWPVLYRSEEDAWIAIGWAFKNSAAIPSRGRIASASVESTYLPKPEAAPCQ